MAGSTWKAEKRRRMVQAALDTGWKRTVRHSVPELRMVLEAYERDEIDSYELDGFVEAAIFGRCVEGQPWMLRAVRARGYRLPL